MKPSKSLKQVNPGKSAKKKAQPKSRRPTSPPSGVPPATKMPKNTFDEWLSKQARSAGRKPEPAQAEEPAKRLPKGTFDVWIARQKPKEEPPSPALPVQQAKYSPSTFDQWMNKQVARRGKEEGQQIASPIPSPAPIKAQ